MKTAGRAPTSPRVFPDGVAHGASAPSLQHLYERISAATCRHHGLGSEERREQHIRAIVAHLHELRAKP